MDTVTSATSAATAATSGSSTATTATAISSDFETFLKMLSTQLQNQDPLNPVDSADYAVQLATFSSVEQQVMTNDLLQSLMSQMVTAGMADLAGWVGMEARSLAPAAYTGSPIAISPDPLAAADETILVVRNEAGSEIYRGEIPVSADVIEWDGLDSAGREATYGNYTFELENYAEDQLLTVDQLESYSLVSEARVISGETVLVTASGSLVPTTSVTGLRQP